MLTMTRMSIQANRNNAQVPAFCNCHFPDSYGYVSAFKQNQSEMVKCRCGENDDLHRLHWVWRQEPESDALIKGQEVIFHPTYSQGTAGVRGAQELSVGMVHYWEIRMISSLTGTDIMFGIGTEDVSFEPYRFAFTSALGSDSKSWGFSCYGYLQHQHKQIAYGRSFSQGSILGVLLDRIHGTLEFYLNRRPLGIAYTNIPLDPAVELYPMICSTAAKTAVRLINAISQPDCLALRAYRALAQSPNLMRDLQAMPGLRILERTYWFYAPELYAQQGVNNNNGLDLADEALLSRRTPRKHKRTENINISDDDDDDIYANAHKILAVASDSEDEYVPNDLNLGRFCDDLN